FVKGVLGATFEPARQGVMNMITPKEILLEATSLSQLSVNTTKVIAPTLGGMLVVLGGARSTFLIEAVGFLLSALFLARLPKLLSTRKEQSEKGAFWSEFRAGVGHIGKSRMLAVAVTIMSVGMFLVFLYDGLIALWTEQSGMNQTQYGTLISAIGFGSVVGALVAGQWNSWRRHPLRMMCSISLCSGCLLALVGLNGLGYFSVYWLLWTGLFFLLGMMSSIRSVPYGYIMQTETPQEMMGRVSAAITAVQTFSMLIAPGIGALLVRYIGIGGVFLGAGAAVTLIGLTFLLTVARTKPASLTRSDEQSGLST
ncbi:MAG: MFS transporter, partial [Tumebacillaceae bacterium]